MSSVASGATTPSQANFKSSPWQDSSWEIVGEAPRGEEFFPMQVNTIDTTGLTADPMFADFGGIAKDAGAARWHLPEHLASAHRESTEQQEAQGKVQVAEEELARIKAEAFEQGRSAGAAAAEAQFAGQYTAAKQSIETVLSDLRVQLEEAVSLSTRRATELAVAIAKKIVDGAVEINPEYVATIIKSALPLAGGAAIKKVRVSPQDMEFIEVVGAQKVSAEFDNTWVFEADPSIRAGCVVETSAGEIDFDLDHAFERVRESVMKVSR